MTRLAKALPGVATVLAMIACYGTTMAVALLSMLGFSIAINQSAWAGAISLFSVLAVVTLAASWRLHRSARPIAVALPGLALILWAMFGSYDRLIELAGFVLLAIATVLDWRARAKVGAPTEVAWIEPHALDDRLHHGPAPVVVDVRGTDEFNGALSHIAQALNLPVGDLPGRLGEIAASKDNLVVLVCRTDRRSSAASAMLQEAGFRQVQVLRGGMERWNQEGRETARRSSKI